MTQQLDMLVCAAVVAVVCLLVAEWVRRRSPFFQHELESTAGRDVTLDGLRGLLALAVFLHHLAMARYWLRTGEFEGSDAPSLRHAGDSAVLFFFMITGYLFWRKALAADGKISMTKLWLNRLRRLGPLFLFGSVLVLLILLPQWTKLSFAELRVPLARMLALGTVGWVPLGTVDTKLVNWGVQWTLWYEWRFYLLLPFIGILARRNFTCLATAIGAWLVFTGRLSDHWLAFLPGMVTAYLLTRTTLAKHLSAPAVKWCLLAWMVGVVVLPNPDRVAVNALVLAPVFLCIAAGESMLGILTHPATRMLGTISYSLYLLHGIVLSTAVRIAGRWITPGSWSEGGFWALALCVGVVVILFCCLTFRWVEHPFYRPAAKPAGAK